MRNLKKLSPLLLVLLCNVLGFGILFLSEARPDMTGLYYSLALLGIVLVSYLLIVFLSLGDEYLFLIVSMLLTVGIIMLFRLDHALAIRQITWFCVGMAGFYLVYAVYRYVRLWPRLLPQNPECGEDLLPCATDLSIQQLSQGIYLDI